MATHSSILAWEIPWTEEPGGCSPWGHRESDTTERLHCTELEHSLAFPNTLGAYLEPGPRDPNWHFSPGES